MVSRAVVIWGTSGGHSRANYGVQQIWGTGGHFYLGDTPQRSVCDSCEFSEFRQECPKTSLPGVYKLTNYFIHSRMRFPQSFYLLAVPQMSPSPPDSRKAAKQ